ncbi:MAG: cytochrome c biogenesis protein CcsA [Bacteroidales bacterium]|nr:cytochrome c biogenesis protein CcsA [Bacteroidales bacterium]
MRRRPEYVSFALLALTVILLVAASLAESFFGSDVAGKYFYRSPLAVTLWAALAFSGVVCLIKRKLWKRIPVFSLHISFVLILAGALITCLTGVRGTIHLRCGGETASFDSDGRSIDLPFALRLVSCETVYYEGTTSPMDYVSNVSVKDGNGEVPARISMNNILKLKGYRFYQSGIDRDGGGSSLSVSYDPAGTGTTYAGYVLLLLSIIAYLLDRNTSLRHLISSGKRKVQSTGESSGRLRLAAGLLVLAAVTATVCLSTVPKNPDSIPPTVPEKTARNLGRVYVHYGGRLCTFSSAARDFTSELCGKPSYRGLSAERIFAGWLFFNEEWRQVPMIRLKGGKRLSLEDFDDRTLSVLDSIAGTGHKKESEDARRALGKYSLASTAGSSGFVSLLPCPENVSAMEMRLLNDNSAALADRILAGEWASASTLADRTVSFQENRIGLSDGEIKRCKFERTYHSADMDRPFAMLCLAAGILCCLLLLLSGSSGRTASTTASFVLSVIMLAYLVARFGIRWLTSGHIPLSNGFETMQFIALCSVAAAMIFSRKPGFPVQYGLLACGAAMLVSVMGGSGSRIASLAPALNSPLLSLHVMVIMLAYTLFAFMALGGLSALLLNALSKGKRQVAASEAVESLAHTGRIMLYFAVFLLTAGIFIGAVWANVTWGRYWGWDPKETWALVTMLVYSAGLHPGILKRLNDPVCFHIFALAAFLCVLVTYFGVNFFFGGLHSYA